MYNTFILVSVGFVTKNSKRRTSKHLRPDTNIPEWYYTWCMVHGARDTITIIDAVVYSIRFSFN